MICAWTEDSGESVWCAGVWQKDWHLFGVFHGHVLRSKPWFLGWWHGVARGVPGLWFWTVLYHNPNRHTTQNSVWRSIQGAWDTTGPPPASTGNKQRSSSPMCPSPPADSLPATSCPGCWLLLAGWARHQVGAGNLIGAWGQVETGVPWPLPHHFPSRSTRASGNSSQCLLGAQGSHQPGGADGDSDMLMEGRVTRADAVIPNLLLPHGGTLKITEPRPRP